MIETDEEMADRNVRVKENVRKKIERARQVGLFNKGATPTVEGVSSLRIGANMVLSTQSTNNTSNQS
jgi:hypothetical protein